MRKSKRKALLGVLIIVVLVLCIGLFMKNKTNTLNSNSIKEGITKELDETLIGAYIQNGDDYLQLVIYQQVDMNLMPKKVIVK